MALGSDLNEFRTHAILGQSACLIGAYISHRAQGFDRRQPSHQRLGQNHLSRAERERDRHDRRQRFRYGGDRQTDRRQEHQDNRLAA